MKITPLNIVDVLLIEPEVFEDDRGFVFESFNFDEFRKAISLDINFVQDNHSKSFRGVLRGLHYQLPPYAQGKLVRVIHGEVLDIALDLRKSSATFGQHVSNILSAKNKKQIWIPEGFAHGVLTLSDNSEIVYKLSNYYNPDYEQCIIWNDQTLNIDWKLNIEFQISSNDHLGKNFLDAKVFL